MKITRAQIAKIISEQIATVNKDEIKDIVMDILSDEGGAAGLDPIEGALEDLEDEDISLPDEPIEDMISGVAGVKRHADGDYIDTTKLEGKIKITKRQLQRIIKEEKAKIQEQSRFGLSLEDEKVMTALILDFSNKFSALIREMLTDGMSPEDVEEAISIARNDNNLDMQ